MAAAGSDGGSSFVSNKSPGQTGANLRAQRSKGLQSGAIVPAQPKRQMLHTKTSLDPKSRNKQLAVAFVFLVANAVVAIVFTLITPADPRLDVIYVSRKQLRTVYLQGFVALLDAGLSIGLVVHVIRGIMAGSLDAFLEAAATTAPHMRMSQPVVDRLTHQSLSE